MKISFQVAKCKWHKIIFPLFIDSSHTLHYNFNDDLILPRFVHKLIIQIDLQCECMNNNQGYSKIVIIIILDNVK